MQKYISLLISKVRIRSCLHHGFLSKLMIAFYNTVGLMKKLHPSASVFILTLILSATVFYSACTSKTKREPVDIRDSISVMAYNVENLFDTRHDANKEDFTYLPLNKKDDPIVQKKCRELATPFWRKDCLELDWNTDVVELKMKRIADTVLQVDDKGPDILILVEVENKNILEELNDDHLGEAHYKTVELIEGEDERGIDVAILSRYPLAKKAILHKIPLQQDEKPVLTRGILQVPLLMPDKKILNVFAVHFPSQHGPSELRIAAAQFLNKLLTEIAPEEFAIAGGDFNVSSQEESKFQIYSNTLGKNWKVSHLLGCQHCEGTHNHRGKWSFFDVLLFSPNFSVDQEANYSVISKSIDTPQKGQFQLDDDDLPLRFNATKQKGVSDHLPILGRFKFKTGN